MNATPDTDEAALNARDERVARKLREAIEAAREAAREAREQAAAAEATASRIEAAVRSERWYELPGVLSNDEIESLCSISPAGLLDE